MDTKHTSSIKRLTSVRAWIGLLLTLGASAALAADVSLTATYTLAPSSLADFGNGGGDQAKLAQAQQNGLRVTDQPSIGSGLARIGTNEFLGITDRGPNGEVQTSSGKRRTFPLADFAPTIVRFRLEAGQIKILQTIPLKDSKGRFITGRSNMAGEERLYGSGDATEPLPFDPSGVDPEAIRVFPDGRYLLSEEYGPSIFVVNTNGEVLVRYTPANKPLPGAGYPVKPILPAIFSQRRANRGFEATALSPDGKTVYAMVQSPLGDEEDKKLRKARVSRVVRLDVTDPLDAKVSGEFLMPISAAADYGPEQKQHNIKLNDAEWLAPDVLLVLEQGASWARLIVADFSHATNLLGRSDVETLDFEAVGDKLSRLTVQPARTEVWASTEELRTITSTKLEGLAVLSPTEIALSNDNDFGIGTDQSGTASTVWLLKLSRPLPLHR